MGSPGMTRLSRRMEQTIANMPKAFRKFGKAFFDRMYQDEPSDAPLKRLLRAFSQPERRSLKTFLDEILGPDCSDEDIELVWSKIPGYDAFTDRCFISSGTRGLLQAVRKELE